MDQQLTILQALKLVMAACRKYTDDTRLICNRDEVSFSGIIDNQYPSLETEDDTLIGAINELHDRIQNIDGGGVDIDMIDITREELEELIYNLYNMAVDDENTDSTEGKSLKEYIDEALALLRSMDDELRESIPVNVSELENDAEYATQEYVSAEIAKAQLEGQDVDLGAYALKSEVKTVDDKVTDIKEKQIEVNILDYENYVTGNDWTNAFVEAFKNAPCTVHVPEGTYNIKYIRVPSNSALIGSGHGTIFNVIADGSTIHNIITNADYANGNENVTFKDFAVKGNRLTLTPPNGYGSGVTFANVKNGLCENVKVEDPSLHCFDVMADKPYQLLNDSYSNNTSYDVNKRSNNIIFRNCEAYRAIDDNFTTHYSDYVYFENCRAYENYHDANSEESENRNGFEVDDGSANVYIRDCYAYKNARGYEVKAHAHSPAPENVVIENSISDRCVIGFQARHLDHHLADQPQSNGVNVSFNNCKCYYPADSTQYPTLNAQAIQISAYDGVNINDFYCIGEADAIAADRSVIALQYKSRNIRINGAIIKGFTNAQIGIYVIGGAQRADKVFINNVVVDGTKQCIAVGGSITDVVINNANLTANGIAGSQGITCSTSNPRISNVIVANAETKVSGGNYILQTADQIDINKKIVLPNSTNGQIRHTLTDGSQVSTLYVTTGNNLRVGSETVNEVNLRCVNNPSTTVNGSSYKLYHEGNKPTPEDIGAISASEFEPRYIFTNGFITLPDNLLIQWGIIDVTSGADARDIIVAFPKPFVDSCCSFTCSSSGVDNGWDAIVSGHALDTSRFRVVIKGMNYTENYRINWIAIGR